MLVWFQHDFRLVIPFSGIDHLILIGVYMGCDPVQTGRQQFMEIPVLIQFYRIVASCVEIGKTTSAFLTGVLVTAA